LKIQNDITTSLQDGHGKFIRVILALNPDPGPFYDITSIDTNTIAVSTGIRIRIVNIKTHKILLTIENDHRCYGITHYDGTLYS
jgi:hypothetical protein